MGDAVFVEIVLGLLAWAFLFWLLSTLCGC